MSPISRDDQSNFSAPATTKFSKITKMSRKLNKHLLQHQNLSQVFECAYVKKRHDEIDRFTACVVYDSRACLVRLGGMS